MSLSPESIEMMEELAQLGSDEWMIAENGYLAGALARNGYVKRRGKDVQIIDKGRGALRMLKNTHKQAVQRQVEAKPQPEVVPEVLTQAATEIEFNMERVTDEAVKRKRRAPDGRMGMDTRLTHLNSVGAMGIQIVPRNDIEPLPPAPAATDDCAPDCQACLPRKALALILRKHPEYQPVLEAVRVLHQFEE